MQTACCSIRCRVRALASLILAAAPGWAGLALAATEPVSQPSPVPVQEELIPDLPEFPTVWQAPAIPLQLFSAQPFGPDDKGGTYTDMGTGQPGHLTQREEALLALGRAAVEAARAAGTLEIRRPELTTPAGANEDLARQKQESLLHPPASVPVLGTGSPADLVNGGGMTAPIPTGPFVLAPGELEKLAAMQNQSGVVVLPPSRIEASGSPQEMNGADKENLGAPRSPEMTSPPETTNGAAKNTEPSVEGK